MTANSVEQPIWSRVLAEIKHSKPPDDYDGVRRNKLLAIAEYTGRPLIVHASACTVPSKILPPPMVMLDFADAKAFETVTEHLPPGPLDILLHTPGGLAEAVESLVSVLRPKFNPVRCIVPHLAKSAGTMLAMSSNEILVHPNGELGPTDPQMIIGHMVISADAILAQFEQARDELLGNPERGIKGDAQKVTLWGPILSTMGPALLVQCSYAKELTLHIVTDFLTRYMFADDPMASAKAQGIAAALNDHSRWLSHGRKISLDDLQRLQVRAKSLSDDPKLMALVDEAWAAIDLTLGNRPAIRLTENQLGHAVVRMAGLAPVALIERQMPAAPQETML